jgi:hypothetical protein
LYSLLLHLNNLHSSSLVVDLDRDGLPGASKFFPYGLGVLVGEAFMSFTGLLAIPMVAAAYA